MKHKETTVGIILILFLAWCTLPPPTWSAGPCDGLPENVTLTGVKNSYYPGSGTVNAGANSITVGAIDTSSGGNATAIGPGDMLLVIQMQDAGIDYTNTNIYGDGVSSDPANGQTALNSSGFFEYVVATSAVVGGAVNIVGAGALNGLLHTYRTEDGNETHGQRTFQVVRIPRYKSAIFDSFLTAAPWNGSTGGILAIDACEVNLGGATVSVDGKGFRGGGGRRYGGVPEAVGALWNDYRFDAWDRLDICSIPGPGLDRFCGADGLKGEGIAGTPRFLWDGSLVRNPGLRAVGYPSGSADLDGSSAMGAPGNAGGGATDGRPFYDPNFPETGGNDKNMGGGGGGNGGAGGYGGDCYDAETQVGGCPGKGNPGAAFPAETGANARLAMGGGGGGGSRNDSQTNPFIPWASSGGLGGGIVLTRACEVTGSGTITANGNGHEVYNPGVSQITPKYDGSGGGGAGGSIVVAVDPIWGQWLGSINVEAKGGDGVDNAQVDCNNFFGSTRYCRHGPGGGGGGGVVWLSGAPASSDVTGGDHGNTTLSGPPEDFPLTAEERRYASTNGQDGPPILNNIRMDKLPGVTFQCDPTWARIGGVRADPRGVIEFATASQVGSRAFHIYETWDPQGRGERTLLTDEAIPASPLAVMETVLYRADTRPLKAPYILIEELQYGGGTHLMGPFPVADELRAQQLSLIEGRMAEKAGRDQQKAAPVAVAFQQNGLKQQGAKASIKAASSTAIKALKIEVSQVGTVRVPVADLVLAGLPATYAASPKQLRLTNLGKPVAFKVVKDATGAALIQFSSTPLATDYTGRNVYVVSWGAVGTPEPRVPFSKSGFAELPGMTRFEANQSYAPFVSPSGDPWIWDMLSKAHAPKLLFDLPKSPAPNSRAITVRIGVYGATDDLHKITAFLNGALVGQVTFSGKAMAEVRGKVPSAMLFAGVNEVTFDISGSTDGALAFVDVIDLGIKLSQPTKVVGYDAIAPYDPSLALNPRDPQYLIIAHGSFLSAANSIAASKSSEYRTAVIDVDRAYDHYSAGVEEARAIAACIAEVRKTSRQKLQYVLLIGGDTWDPRDFMSRGSVSFIPSLNGWDEIFGRVPSENRYADTDGDGLPEVAIGRLPVSTPEEAQVLAKKIANQTAMTAAGNGGPVHLMAVDNQGPNDASFYNAALEIQKHLPSNSSLKWADVGADPNNANANLLDGLQGGAQATHFFGHGGFDFWTNNGLLTLEDVVGLAGWGKATVVFAWTCQVQNYQWGSDQSPPRSAINEALILVPNGGAVACVGPAGLTVPYQQRKLYLPLYDNLKNGMTLGQALRSAKVKALQSGESVRSVVDGWNLLGDPSLKLNWKTTNK